MEFLEGPVSQPLSVLNEQAKRQTFALTDVDWSAPIDLGVDWLPEELMSVSYLPAFSSLSAAVRRRYTQLYGMAVCEQFIWFEEDLLGRILANILQDRTLTVEMRECLENFQREEERHSEMFRRVLQKVDPALGRVGDYRLFNITRPQRLLFNCIVHRPAIFLTWIWLIIYFEERTLHISRLYRQARRRGVKLEATFYRAHELHMIDEARHLQIDQHLLKAFYAPAPRWKKRLSAWLTRKIFAAYRSPRRIAWVIIDILKKEFPAECVTLEDLKRDLPTLAQNIEFRDSLFGKQAIGRTEELLARHPEMALARRSLVQ